VMFFIDLCNMIANLFK